MNRQRLILGLVAGGSAYFAHRRRLLAPAEASTRLDNLTGLRGVAAYAVLLGHAIDWCFLYSGPPAYNVLDPFAKQLAYFGMSLFFVLSGFVIHYNYVRLFQIERFSRALYTFFVARFSRLYPLYGLLLLWELHRQQASPFAGHGDVAFAYLTLTQSWFNVEQTIFAPAWSISTEMFFYLFFAVVAVQFARLRAPTIALIVFIVCAVAGLRELANLQIKVLPSLDALLFQGPSISAGSANWLWYYSPLVRLPEFIVGMLASALYGRLRVKLVASGLWLDGLALTGVVWCAGLALCGAFGQMPLGELTMNFGWAPAIAVILIGTSGRRSRLSSILSSRAAVAAGNISYSVYMVQMSIMLTLGGGGSVEATMGTVLGSSFKLAMIFVFTTYWAYGMHNLIEVPMQRLLRRLMLPVHTTRPPIAAALGDSELQAATPRDVAN